MLARLFLLLLVSSVFAPPGQAAVDDPSSTDSRPKSDPESQDSRLRDVSLLTFEGQQTFDAEQLRRALKSDSQVVATVNHFTPVATFHSAVVHRLADGYRANGFFDVQVEVSRTSHPAKIQITEGTRYCCGEVRITGGENIDHGELLKVVTDSDRANTKLRFSTDAKSEFWKQGEVVDLSSSWSRKLEKRIQSHLAADGFQFASFTTQIAPETATQQAVLNIDLTNVGTRQPISHVQISGLTRHTQQQIIDFLDLPRPLRAHKGLEQQISDKLLNTGRFVFVNTRVETAFEPEQPVPLQIKLMEYEKVVPLSEELPVRHEALIRLSRWLRNFDRQQHDLRICMELHFDRLDELQEVIPTSDLPQELISQIDLKAVYGATGGAALWVQMKDQTSSVVLDLETQLCRNLPAIVDHVRKQKWVAPDWRMGPQISFDMTGFEPTDGKKFKTGIGASLVNNRRGFSVAMSIEPAALINLAEKMELKSEVQQGICFLTSEHFELRIALETGQLLSLTAGDEKEFLEVVARKGLLAEMVERGHQRASEWQNVYQAKLPFTSLIGFCAATTDQFLAPCFEDFQSPIPVLLRVLQEGVTLSAIEVALQNRSSKPQFTIPSNKPRRAIPFQNQWAFLIATYLIPEESPARRLLEACTQRQLYGDTEVVQHLRDEILLGKQYGPLTCLMTGYLLGDRRGAGLAGLKRLQSDKLPAEIDVLISSDGLMKELCTSVVRLVRGLTEDELTVLRTTLNPEAVAGIQLVQSCTADDEIEVARKVALLAWKLKGYHVAEAKLNSWAQLPAPANSVFRTASKSESLEKEEKADDDEWQRPAEVELNHEPIFQSKNLWK